MVVSVTGCSKAPVSRIDTAGRTGVAATGTTFPLWSCGTMTSSIPDLGVSDVASALFGALVNIDRISTPTWYANPYNAGDESKLDALPTIAVVFGVPVSNTIGGVANAVPNLSKQQVASILSGTYTDWHQVKSSIPTGTPINICRHVAGSGIQAGANALFLGNPCLAPFGGNLPVVSADTSLGAHVFENSSSGAVVSCMNSKGNAIGLLGIATQPGGSDSWHFATIDGQAATNANTAQGVYDFFVESTYQYRKSTPYSAVRDLMDDILARVGDPGRIAAAGIPGVLALATNGWMPDSPYVSTNPVTWATRTSGYTSGSTCSQTQLFFP